MIWVFIFLCLEPCWGKQTEDDLDVSDSNKPLYRRYYITNSLPPEVNPYDKSHPEQEEELEKVQEHQQHLLFQQQQAPASSDALQTLLTTNPLFAALFLSSSLGIHPVASGYNHPQHLPTNPYVSLLLSHYGRYLSVPSRSHGIYGYVAANNYHNNKPFGAYKVFEDTRK